MNSLAKVGIAGLVVAAVAVAAQAQVGGRMTGAAALPRTFDAASTMMEKPWEQLTDKELKSSGKIAMPDVKLWKHGETEHFVFHFQKLPTAQLAARNCEYYYAQLKLDFGLTQPLKPGKIHAFIFSSSNDWDRFLVATRQTERFTSLVRYGEIFIIGPAAKGNFSQAKADDSFTQSLAFPVTLSMFLRFFPKPMPFWLRIGMGEYERHNAYAKLRHVSAERTVKNQQANQFYPLDELLAAKEYPEGKMRPYAEAAERLAVILLTKLDYSRFKALALKLGDGVKLEQAVVEVYPEKFKTFDDFARFYAAN